jgi:hypothetical protein
MGVAEGVERVSGKRAVGHARARPGALAHCSVMAAPGSERTRTTSATRTPPDRNTRILWFNVSFFGTLAWLSSSARASEAGDWWHRIGQLPLMLTGLILFWIAWWHLDKGRTRPALALAGPATVILSVWITSVHGAAL